MDSYLTNRHLADHASKIRDLSRQLRTERYELSPGNVTTTSGHVKAVQDLAEMVEAAAEEVAQHIQQLGAHGPSGWFSSIGQAIRQLSSKQVKADLQKLDRLRQTLHLYLTADTR